MIYIVIEINGFNQLRKVNKNLVSQILNYMDASLNTDKCGLIFQKNDIFIYTCPAEGPNLNSLFVNTINLFKFLELNKNDLYGYNIFISQSSKDYSQEQIMLLIHKIFLIKDDESYYVSNGIYSLFKGFAEFTLNDKFYKLTSYNEESHDDGDNIVKFLSKRENIDQYFETIIPFINSDKKGYVFFYSEKKYKVSILSFCIAGLLQGKTLDVPWLYISPDKSDISFISSLLNSMDTVFINKVEDYLVEPELSIWGDNIHFLHQSNYMITDEDAIILFRIYLKAYSRKMRELLLPPIVFILNTDDFKDATLNYVASVLEDLYSDLNLLPVLFSTEEDIPVFFDGFHGKKKKIEPWILQGEDPCINNSLPEESIGLSPVSFYHIKRLLIKRKEVYYIDNPSIELLKELGHSTKQFLLIYTLFFDLCSKDTIISYLSTNLPDKVRNEQIFKDLVNTGFIYPDPIRQPVFYDIDKKLAYTYTRDDKQLFEKIVEELNLQSEVSEILVYEQIANIYKKLNLPIKEADYLLRVIKLLIVRGVTEKAVVFFERISLILRENLTNSKDIELRQSILFLKAAIYDNKDDFAEEVYLRLNKMNSKNLIPGAEKKIVCSEYLYSMFEYDKALQIAKLALIDVQDSGDSILTADVNIDLACIMLGLERIEESKDYFKIAKETIGTNIYNANLITINIHQAVVNFIYGNFSESLRLINESRVICKNTGRRDWELFGLFLYGRLFFEMGDYRKAIIIFTDGLNQCDLYFDGENKELFNIWLGRCWIYLKEVKYGLNILKDYEMYSEAVYFAAEGLFFQGEYNSALNRIESAFEIERDRVRYFCSSNIVSWESGYDLIEDRSFIKEGSHGVLFQLIRAFKAFLVAKNGQYEAGREELVRLTREDRLSEIDPNNGYYYYLHALTFPEYSGAEAVDRLTLLSKALRHIQQTASHIDNPKHRQMYLSDNYWKCGLMNEGRANKII